MSVAREALVAWRGAAPATRRHGLVVAGAVCSGLIALASVPLGYLGYASNLWFNRLFAFVRASPPVAVLAGLCLIVGVFGLLACWALLGRMIWREQGVSTRDVLRAACAWSAPLLVALPLFSRDVFSYVAQGTLLVRGVNPYLHGVNVFGDWAEFGVDRLWSATITPYGAVWLGVEGAIAGAILPHSYMGALFAFRLVSVGGLALMGYFAWKIALYVEADPRKALWAVLACPLAITSFTVSMHNDSLMLALILAGVWMALRGRHGWAWTLVTLAVGVKSVAIIALPIVGLIAAGPGARWGAKVRVWTLDVAACVASLTAAAAAMGLGWSLTWLSGGTVPLSVGTWFSPTTIVATLAGTVAGLAGPSGPAVTAVVKGLGTVAAVLLGTWVLATPRPMPVLTRLFLAFSAVLALSPVIHPWYVMWCLAFAAAAGLVKDRATMMLTALTTAFLLLQHLISSSSYDASSMPMLARALFNTLSVGIGAAAVLVVWWRHRDTLRELHPIRLALAR